MLHDMLSEQMIDLKFPKRKPFQVRVHLTDMRQRKEMVEFHWLSRNV